jgi:hypothetical protein
MAMFIFGQEKKELLNRIDQLEKQLNGWISERDTFKAAVNSLVKAVSTSNDAQKKRAQVRADKKEIQLRKNREYARKYYHRKQAEKKIKVINAT